MSLELQEISVYFLVAAAAGYLVWNHFGVWIRTNLSSLILKTGNVKLAQRIRPKQKSGAACSSGCACPSRVR